MNILTVNLLFSTFVYWIAVRIYLMPKLADLSPHSVLVPILLLHDDAEPFMGPAYWIPAFWVPALLVTHVVTVIILVRHSDRLLPRDAPA